MRVLLPLGSRRRKNSSDADDNKKNNDETSDRHCDCENSGGSGGESVASSSSSSSSSSTAGNSTSCSGSRNSEESSQSSNSDSSSSSDSESSCDSFEEEEEVNADEKEEVELQEVLLDDRVSSSSNNNDNTKKGPPSVEIVVVHEKASEECTANEKEEQKKTALVPVAAGAAAKDEEVRKEELTSTVYHADADRSARIVRPFPSEPKAPPLDTISFDSIRVHVQPPNSSCTAHQPEPVPVPPQSSSLHNTGQQKRSAASSGTSPILQLRNNRKRPAAFCGAARSYTTELQGTPLLISIAAANTNNTPTTKNYTAPPPPASPFLQLRRNKKRPATAYPGQETPPVAATEDPSSPTAAPAAAEFAAVAQKVVASSAAALVAAKRPRPDSKPAAKPSPLPLFGLADRTKMAVGGRRKSGGHDDDDDESSTAFAGQQPQQRGAPPLPHNVWVQPAENEPPGVLRNRHPAILLSSSSAAASLNQHHHHSVNNDSDDPVQEDERELPEISPTVEQAATAAAVAAAAPVPNVDMDDAILAQFCDALKKQGLEMVEQEGDGNCLFRAVSLQVYGSPDNHGEVRERCMDFMARNEEHYSNFVATVASDDDDEDAVPVARAAFAFQAYIARKRINGVHGNHAEIQAISELFNRPVEVYTPPPSPGTTTTAAAAAQNGPQQPLLQPMNFHAEYKTSDPPIRLSYHDGNHYNAIIDPLVPTAGLGLGLPGLKPGLADQMQVTKAKAESDQLADEIELERVIKESREELNGQQDDELQRVLKESSMDFMYKQKAMALSDLDATNFELEQKVLASSMESYFRQEHGRKQKASAPASASSGRRRRGSPPPPRSTDEPVYSSSFAAIPPPVAAAALPVAAAAALSSPPFAASMAAESGLSAAEDYPETVQELVMNGFELEKVVRAYEFIGDRFDDLLSFLLSSNGSS